MNEKENAQLVIQIAKGHSVRCLDAMAANTQSVCNILFANLEQEAAVTLERIHVMPL